MLVEQIENPILRRFRSGTTSLRRKCPLLLEQLEQQVLLTIPPTETTQLLAADAADFDWFGTSADVSGDTAVIGSPFNDAVGSRSGAVYVFDCADNTACSEVKQLTKPESVVDDDDDDEAEEEEEQERTDRHLFAKSVAISEDTVVVGAPGDDHAGAWSGSAYVFDCANSCGAHQLTASAAAAGDFFGESVDISGNWIVVGARLHGASDSRLGAAFLFDCADPAACEQVAELTKPQEEPLEDVDEAEDEDEEEEVTPKVRDLFGKSVAISGTTVVVGAPATDYATGAVYVFDCADSTCTLEGELTADDAAPVDFFGSSVDISGELLVAGAYRDDDGGRSSGSAYVFSRSGTTWTQQAKLTADDQRVVTFLARASGFLLINTSS